MAVYTEVPDDALAAFVADYDIGTLTSCKGIAEGVENSNYLLTTDRGRYILTLYEKRVAKGDLPFFLGLMEHLAAAGLSCPTPLRDRHGAMLLELAGKPAALVSFLEGLSLKRPHVRHCAGLGEALANLHRAGKGFALKRPNSLSLPGWHELAAKLGVDADQVNPGLHKFIAEELSLLSICWPTELPAGVIHADLFPNNVFFMGDRLTGLIDFYFACNDFLAYDIAVGLCAWCFEDDGSYNITKGQGLLTAYAAARPLTSAERAALPLLARGAALRFLLTRAYDWLHTPQSALVKRLDPNEYIRKLRFLQKISHVRELGLDLPV
jgi:homoserine kinase type II